MIDDDMSFEPDKVIEMVKKGKDFICAIGNLKSDTPRYACQPYTDAEGIPLVEEGLIWAKGVGGALTIHTKEIFKKLIAKFPEKKCLGMDPEYDKYGYSFYSTSYDRQGIRTEDQNFCDLVSIMEEKIWVYPDMNFGHFGGKDYKGNYHEYLLNLPPPLAAINKIGENLKGLRIR